MDEEKRIYKMNKDWKDETKAIHAAGHIDGDVGAVSTPIFQTSTYRVAEPGDESGYVYSRTANPTREALETALAAMEGGTYGFAFASGMAAVNTVMSLLSPGDHIIAGDDLYGGTFRLFEKILKTYGLDFTYVDGRRPTNIAAALTSKTRLIWLETPTNPLMRLYEIGATSEIARTNGCLLAVDNTFATPCIQRPLELGADIIIHSLTKYISGHADTVGGAIIVNDAGLAEKIGFLQNSIGAILGPFDSFLSLRGLKTLPLRMKRHSHNAKKIAEYLMFKRSVSEVFYPGIDGMPLPNNMALPGGMVSFSLDFDINDVKNFVMSTSLFVLAESLGGVESLINHPATMTHASIPREIRMERGINDGLIRLSVGLEHVDDLISDLESAFEYTFTKLKQKT
jgi:cystathionine gamma-lyase